MEVFIRNLPNQTSDQNLKKYFQTYLNSLSIRTFSCQRFGKNATLTFLHESEGQVFLAKYGQVDNGSGRRFKSPNAIQLYMMGVPIYCTKSKRLPNELELRCLQEEAKLDNSRKVRAIGEQEKPDARPKTLREFICSSVSCGVWSYESSDLVFISHLKLAMAGKVYFRPKALRVEMDMKQIEIPYSWIVNITVGGQSPTSMTITCRFAPKFSEKSLETEMEVFLRELTIDGKSKKKKAEWTRVSSLDSEHQKIVSSCLVYRVDISSSSFIEEIRTLKAAREIPLTNYLRTSVRAPREPLDIELTRLRIAFISSHSSLPFPVKFQMQRLAQDGYLPPSTVMSLFPEISLMVRRSGIVTTVSTIRKLFLQVPYRGPEAEAQEFHLETLLKILRDNEDRSKREELYSGRLESSSTPENMANIYRALVTPAGVYIHGPELETKNRVLRKYHNHLDYFLRVQFCDEDGQQLRFDPRVSNDDIFYSRFKNVLNGGINIGDRLYGFLGFSHSSLRSQTCWFMAPFIHNGVPQLYQKVIENLGDFSHIQCPAKCAARIGQAFSDTPSTVPLGSVTVLSLPDVQRNGRFFSDGVGIFSESVLQQIWDALPSKRLVKPTLFQIRHQGAKGMISLDSRITSHSLFLRPSMVKFSGSDSTDLEICEGAYHPLPMFLNRQLIKIMEDLGVEDNYFLDLQANAIVLLRDSCKSTLNASKYLAAHSVGEVVRLPWFMKQLISLNLSFHEDAFLRDVVELSVLVELRELKHRSRIRVEDGATLFGIMDETGILEEDEVFIIVDVKLGMSKVITGENVIATRCPALHPGDVQLVTAVTVPDDSPLMKLTNCVCFSRKGSRDLPSKLSGGDLDGDKFNLIWDINCTLKHVFDPADYPRQQAMDIGRKVTREDMTSFFVQFMATDQLGRIATLHQVLADKYEEGTVHQDCLMLANMHSTAVDFSKTGIPVNLSLMPKYTRLRPDFMAPGPHVKIQSKDSIKFDDEDSDSNKEIDDETQGFRYYPSDKVIGKLYRAIDERDFFQGIQTLSKQNQVPGDSIRSGYSNTSVMDSVWNFVERRCRSLKWKHHLVWARDIREWYDEYILNIMEEYSEHPLRPLTELEVFVGNILGRNGKQSKPQRELSKTIKERFDADVGFIINNIIKDGAEPSLEALERSVACFEISFEIGRRRKSGAELISFKYVAAAVCLKEIERCNGSRLRYA